MNRCYRCGFTIPENERHRCDVYNESGRYKDNYILPKEEKENK